VASILRSRTTAKDESPTLQMMIKQKIKLRITRYAIRNTNRKGIALLVVLFIIMAITILSLGFLSGSDVELACGQNMILRTQMDYLAESGLEHARGLILNPQDLAAEYWTGDSNLQLVDGSSDYYDIRIIRDENEPNNYCNYNIECDAYRRLADGSEVGRSSSKTVLRLDPCIALWMGANTTLWSEITTYGDVYCNGTLTNQGAINGDVFANNSPANITGQRYGITDLSLSWPNVTVDDFKDKPGVNYQSGSYSLSGNESINGMLLVDGDLTVSGIDNVIVAGKNLPALYVTGDLMLESNATLDVNGLVVVDNCGFVSGGASLNVLGGLFIQNTIAETTEDSSSYDNISILYNGPTFQSDGDHTALRFDGIDDYVQTPDDLTKLQLTNDYTLAVWIKADSSQKIWAGIVSKTNSTGSTNHWTLQFDTSTSRKVVIYHPTGSWDTKITLSDVADAWHHIGIVRQGNTMFSYLDGNPIHSNTWNVGPGNGDGHLNIGADRTASSSYVYKGLIDDVRVYDRALALDPNEIVALPYDSSLIGYWKFDESGSVGVVSVTAAPAKTAILVGPQDAQQRWGQAAGAFFRSIQRK
jgi:hypothetical protein